MPSKVNCGNYFEDFSLDQTLVHATPRTLTQGDVALYIALTGSRFLLNSSIKASKRYGFKDQLVDNLLVFHIAFGKTVPDISQNAIANLGYAEVKFVEPVFVGDTISVSSQIIGLRENSHKKSGIVYVSSKAINQWGRKVLSWKRWVMVNKRDPQAICTETFVPNLKSLVEYSELTLPRTLRFDLFDVAQSGSPYLWEDYTVGERIDHRDGMTIDNSDHTLATKLYQNSARVHFDEIYMQQSAFKKRLMYGGHVISICRSLSYNGLGNGLILGAINSGTHVAPAFAGDTLYAFSKIIEKWCLSPDKKIGAIRVKTWGVKNTPTEGIATPEILENNQIKYNPNIVLELDYTLLFPTK